jgi:hypothetical protein
MIADAEPTGPNASVDGEEDVAPATSRRFDRRLGVEDLYHHSRAAEAIDIFRAAGLVGNHPLYLVGFAIPEHRRGPGLVALLVLNDGRLLAVRHRGWPLKKKLPNSLFQFDLYACDVSDIRRYSSIWRAQLGGFPGLCADCESDYAAARSMLKTWAESAFHLGRAVADSDGSEDVRSGSRSALPTSWGGSSRFDHRWDMSDAVEIALSGVGVDVYGFSPDLDDVLALELPLSLKQSMIVPPADSHHEPWMDEITATYGPDVSQMLLEALAVRISSPRSTIVLVRTIAERVVDSVLGPPTGSSNFDRRIGALEKVFEETPLPDRTAAAAKEKSWRGQVSACLHTIREHGNFAHDRQPIEIAHAIAAIDVLRELTTVMARRRAIDSGNLLSK